MNRQLRADLDATEAILERTKELACEYLQSLDERPAAVPQSSSTEQRSLPETGLGAQRMLEQFREAYAARLSGSPGPRYLGFVTGGGTPAAVAADWLVSVYDQNAQRNGDSCAMEIEMEAISLLRSLYDLPDAMHGTFVTGATMSNAMGMAVARQALGKSRGIDVAADGIGALGRVRVLSGAIHSSTRKAMSFCGFGRNAYEAVPLQPGREAIDVAALRTQLAADREVPTIVVANAGTVNTVDFDDLQAIAALREEFPFWLHVDGAFGAFAACSPRYSLKTQGMQLADSLTIDAHKWLNVPYDSAMFFTPHLQHQLDVFQNISSYLPPPALAPDNVLHLTPENSRRWRALPVWFSLMAYGREGYREIVERCCDLARCLGEALLADGGFTVLNAPVEMNVVCFAPLVEGRTASQAEIAAFLQRVTADGTTFCTPSFLDGKPIIRAAFSNWRTEIADLDKIMHAFRRCHPSAFAAAV